MQNKDSLSLIGHVTAEEVNQVMRLLKAKWCFVACLIWSIKSYLLNKRGIITIHLLQYMRKCCNSSRLFYFLSNNAL